MRREARAASAGQEAELGTCVAPFQPWVSSAHSRFCAQESLQQIPSLWKGVSPGSCSTSTLLRSCKQPLCPFPCLWCIDIENVLLHVTDLCLGKLKLKLWLQVPSPEKSSFSALSLPICQNSLYQFKKK